MAKNKDLKNEIDNISKKILLASPSLNKQFLLYIDNSKEIAKFKTRDPEKLKKVEEMAEKDLMKQIGNKILKIEREIIKKEYQQEQHEIYVKNQISQSVTELISLFSQLNSSSNSSLKGLHNSQEKTKEQKAEERKKYENTSNIEW